MLQSVFIPTFEGVLLAAMEFNREVEKVSVEETERKPINATIHCADENEEGKMATNGELGTNKLERNVEAAWTNRSKSAVGKDKTFCMFWYRIFLFLGKTEN